MKCLRPDCGKELNTGKKYCSGKCSAIDRKRVKLEKAPLAVPKQLMDTLTGAVGAESAALVALEVNRYLQEDMPSIPLPLTGQTYGDLVLSYDGTKEYRPSTTLSFDVIEKMLRSGPVIFAMEMKRAQVFRVFSSGRYKIVSPDEELAEVAEAVLKLIMPKMMHDVTWSAFAYGTAFAEEVWEWKTKYQLGMMEEPEPGDVDPKAPSHTNPNAKFLVPKVPNSVNPATIDHIRRTKDGSFDGFAQKRKYEGGTLISMDPIIVNREQALVIPLNEHFRNLWGESTLKPMYTLWLWYEIIFRTMVRYMDRMAIPWKVAKAPSRATVTVSGSSAPVRAMDLALALAANLDKSGAVAIPSDVDENGNALWDLSLLTAESRTQLFLEVLQYLGQEMIRAALSADRATTQSSGGVGSYAIGEVHAAASAVTSEMILLQILHYLNMYFIPEFSLYNRGVDGPPIWLRTQSIDTAERELLMQLIGVAGNSPAAMEMFYMVDWRTLLETSNIPALDESDVKELKDELDKAAEEKMKTQQEIMAANKAPIPTGGAGINPQKNVSKPAVPAASNPDGTSPTKKAEDEQAVALENIFKHQIPWMLGEHEATILYENGLVSEEVIQLFNPFHDAMGRFSNKTGGDSKKPSRRLFKEANRAPFQLKGSEYISPAIKTAGASGVAVVVLDRLEKSNSVPEKYKDTIRIAKGAAKVTSLAAGGIAGYLSAAVHGRAAASNLHGLGTEIRREMTYQGVNKKPVFERIKDSFNYARKGIGHSGISMLGVVGGVTCSAILWKMATGKDMLSMGSLSEKFDTASKVMSSVIGEGWKANLLDMFLKKLEEDELDQYDLSELFQNQDVIEGIFTFWFLLGDLDKFGDIVDDLNLSHDNLIQIYETVTYFIVGYLDEQSEVTPLEESTIQLFNPFHDDLGRFASKSGRTIGVASLVLGLASTGARAYSRYKVSKGTDPNSNVISTKIGNREISLTYDQLERGGSKGIKIAKAGRYIGTGLAIAGFVSSLSSTSSRSESANKKAEQEWSKPKQDPKASWPQAKQEDFQKMYRGLAKKYHPDVNNKPDANQVMQDINNMYGSGDFDGIRNLFVQLESILPQAMMEEIGLFLGVFLGLLKEFLDSDNQYLVFEVGDVVSEDYMVIEDGELILDRAVVNLIFSGLEYGLKNIK